MKEKRSIIMIKNPTYRHYLYPHIKSNGDVCTRITAVSTFAGRIVKGHADCHPDDEFDLEYGKALAEARCNEKIAARRCKRAYSKVDEAAAQVIAAMMHYEKMLEYEADAEENYNIASYELATILSEKQCHCNGECGENCECDCHK
jgi:transaldolase